MLVLTASGEREARMRGQWPLAGANAYSNVYGNAGSVPLVPLPSGKELNATYASLYRSNPYVHACVQTVARGLAMMPLHVYRDKADGQRERVRAPSGRGAPSHAAKLAALLERPNPTQSWHELLTAVLVDRNVYGNALIVVTDRDQYGVPTELWHVPWVFVEVLAGELEPIRGYRISGTYGARQKTFDPIDAIHLGKGSDPGQLVGVSPLAPLGVAAALQDAIQRHLLSLFRNQARPSANVKLPQGSNKRDIENVAEQVKRMYTAPENAGKVVVTTGDWQPVNMSNGEAEVVNLQRVTREEICGVYSVPPPLVGILDRAIMSNVRELTTWFVRYTLGPHAKRIEDDLQAQLIDRVPQWQGLFVEFALEQALKPDIEARAKAYKTLSGVYTPNEMRALENLPRLEQEGADSLILDPGAGTTGEDMDGEDDPDKGEAPPPPDELEDDEDA